MLDAQNAPQVVRLEDYRPPAWLIPEVELTFDLDAAATRVTARLTVTRNGAHAEPLLLDGDELTLASIALDGRLLGEGDYTLTPSRLVVPIDGERAVLETIVALSPATNTKLMGLYASGGNLCTQCEAQGFRRITFFADRPDVLSRYAVTLNADKTRYPVLLANGNPAGSGELGDGRHWARWDDPFPKPCYLFAVVAGALHPYRDSFTTMSGRHVDLAIWVAEADVPRCAHAMAALKASMTWDEKVYGREYDLDVFNIVAVSDFNFGAMENKGLNVFNSKYILADADTATDADFDAVAGVVAHEYFHNWTGNRVTCRDWFQLSLKEGLTVYRDQEFSADQGSRAVKRIEDVRALRGAQFPEDAGPLAHPVRPESYIEISNFYTATVYNKGGEVIRMMAALLGPENYRKGADLYFDRHDGQAVTVEDWVKAMEDASGVDLRQFRRWYSQAGTPRVSVAVEADGADTLLRFTQSLGATPGQPVKEPMHIPMRVALHGRDGSLGDERLVELREHETVVRFPGHAGDAVPSLNRGFTAPVTLAAPTSRADLGVLAATDDDPFARYEAAQRLALDVITSGVAGTDESGAEIVAGVAATLDAGSDGGLDPAFVAEAVLLPSEAFVGDQMASVDPDAIHRVRANLRVQLAEELNERWWRAYRDNSDNRYDTSGPAKARRRLKNVALGYLTVTEAPDAITAAFAQFEGADNMTDRLAALGYLVSTHAPEREAALAAFHARYAHDPLVIDKWFTAQALSNREDALAQVVALASHPDFSRANPNRLRSLVGAFAVNQARFHDAGGGGYRFVADEVLAVDALNPQSAARLVQPLGRWKRFDDKRAGLMRAELERVLARPGLSKDVYEVASKSLA